ncbi:MAG: hypothetical protein QM722_12105 [Piscinibacter sp.]
MIDRIFSALLTFCLLAGGTVAIGSALVDEAPAAATPVVMLPAVTVIGTRDASGSPLARNDVSAEPSARNLQ